MIDILIAAHVEPQPDLRSEIVLLTIGNLRSYNGCNIENATLKWNFALGLRLFYVDNEVHLRLLGTNGKI